MRRSQNVLDPPAVHQKCQSKPNLHIHKADLKGCSKSFSVPLHLWLQQKCTMLTYSITSISPFWSLGLQFFGASETRTGQPDNIPTSKQYIMN